MTSRERWILYPLLFLTLGITIRDKFFEQTVPLRAREVYAEQIHCRYLSVSEPGDRGEIPIAVVPGQSGALELFGRTGRRVVVAGADDSGQAGLVETFDAHGSPRVRLGANLFGGTASTFGVDRKVRLTLGQFGAHYGVFAESSARKGQRLLTLPWWLDVGPAPSQTGETSPKPSGEQPTESPAP
ncbi:MAG: hypothetical protein JXB62_22495 [Pirellulales bacterium]|nr:hypothetical protein [Pirellulales bacterium]